MTIKLETYTKTMLAGLEEIAARRITRRKRNKEIFEKDQEDEKLFDAKLKELRAHYAATCLNGPPPGWEKTAHPATGMALEIEVQFRGGNPTYDPTKLPAIVLHAPGVVTKVDAKAIEALVQADPVRFDAELEALKAAYVPVGPWEKPTVLVKPLVP